LGKHLSRAQKDGKDPRAEADRLRQLVVKKMESKGPEFATTFGRRPLKSVEALLASASL